jgi:O-antigen/teichoic acid export membrane protein
MPTVGRHVRHSALNLLGTLAPLAVGVAVMPLLVHALGPARFGVLGLSWAVLEYFTVFDAGLGRATQRAVATRLGDGADVELSALITGSFALQLALGVVGAIVLLATAPALVTDVLHVPLALRAEATSALRVLALLLPLVLAGVMVRGLLEAAQRFDLSNMLRAPSTTATFAVPAVAAVAGADLPTMLGWLAVVRVIALAGGAWMVARAMPGVRWRWPRDWRPLRELLAFGGWVTVSNVLSPVLLLFDRLALGALAGVAAVGYYVGPYEASARLFVVPASVVASLFPTAALLAARGALAELRTLYQGSLRVLVVAMLGAMLVAIAIAPAGLAWWLGPETAARAGTAFRLLLGAVLLTSIVHIPFAFLQAAGRPDVTARIHVLEVAIHVPVVLVLVQRFGITGAAMAWALRSVMDALLVFLAAARVLGMRARWGDLGQGVALLVAAAAALVLGLAAASAAPRDPPAALALVLAAAVVYVGITWRAVLSAPERAQLAAFVRRRAAPAPRY